MTASTIQGTGFPRHTPSPHTVWFFQGPFENGSNHDTKRGDAPFPTPLLLHPHEFESTQAPGMFSSLVTSHLKGNQRNLGMRKQTTQPNGRTAKEKSPFQKHRVTGSVVSE